MAFLKVKEEDIIKEEEGGYIQTSGIYPLTLKYAEIANTVNGATQVNYLFDSIMSYGNIILGTDSKPTFGYKILEALTVVIGESELSEPEAISVKFKTGSKELNCIPELQDVEVKAWVQFSYNMYQGEIRERVLIKRFYRDSDNASGTEVLTNENIGTRYEKDLSVASEVAYEDGVTPEAVKAWKASQLSAGTPTKSAAEVAGVAKSSKAAGKAKPGFPQ